MKALGKLRLGVNIDHVATVRNARGGNCVGRIAEDKDALAGQVGGIDRSGVPREPQAAVVGIGVENLRLAREYAHHARTLVRGIDREVGAEGAEQGNEQHGQCNPAFASAQGAAQDAQWIE